MLTERLVNCFLFYVKVSGLFHVYAIYNILTNIFKSIKRELKCLILLSLKPSIKVSSVSICAEIVLSRNWSWFRFFNVLPKYGCHLMSRNLISFHYFQGIWSKRSNWSFPVCYNLRVLLLMSVHFIEQDQENSKVWKESLNNLCFSSGLVRQTFLQYL